VSLDPGLADTDKPIRLQLEREALYVHYIDRQKREIAAVARDEAFEIPVNFNYTNLSGLSNELRLKLGQIRPKTLGQASRIEGITPAALTLILGKLRQLECRRAVK